MDQTSNKKCKNKGTNKKSNIYKVLAPSQVVQDFFHQQYYPLPPQWLSLSPFLGGNRALVRYVHEKHVRVGQHTDRNESYAWWTKILHDLGWFKRCWIDGTCALSTGAWMVNSSKTWIEHNDFLNTIKHYFQFSSLSFGMVFTTTRRDGMWRYMNILARVPPLSPTKIAPFQTQETPVSMHFLQHLLSLWLRKLRQGSPETEEGRWWVVFAK